MPAGDAQEGYNLLKESPLEPQWTTATFDENKPRRQAWHSQRVLIISLVSAGFISLALLILSASFISGPSVVSCGSSISEAKSLGCMFDNLSGSWVHATCYDAELTAEHDSYQWKYYRDKNATEELSSESISISTETVVRSTTGEHYVHCALALRKLHKALIYDAMVEDMYLEYVHTKHCTKLLGTPLKDPDALRTAWIPGFLTCSKARKAVFDTKNANNSEVAHDHGGGHHHVAQHMKRGW